jgi:colicin import membrane protein
MATVKIDDQVKQYFDSNPKADSFLVTSDGAAFFAETGINHANAHAGNLRREQKDDTVTTVTRAQVEAWWATTPEGAYEAAKKIADTDAAELATAQKALDDAKVTKDKALISQAQATVDAAAAKSATSAGVTAAALKVITDAKDEAANAIAQAKQAAVDAGKAKIAAARKAKGLK